MRNGFQLGRLFGIKLIIDWSWLFIFVFITWGLTLSLSGLHQEWGLSLSLVVAMIAALLFFVSVLAHELAHAVVAIAQGLRVRNITLFLLGGMANIEKSPPSPRAEFLIAIAGPIASFLLGGSLLWLGSSLGGIVGAIDNPDTFIGRLGPVETVLLWLGSINIMLAIFNLLPGFPLDGGRVLRAALWAGMGDFRRATCWATSIGKMVAGLFMVAGLAGILGAQMPFLARGPIGGLWLIVIGWFLFSAAAQSYRRVVVQELLDGLPVAHFMRSGVPTVGPATSLDTLVREHVIGADERAFPVVVDEELVGLISLEDIRKAPRTEWDRLQVETVMTPVERLAVARPEDEVMEAIGKLGHRGVSQIPVLEDGRFIGVLHHRDIARWLELHGNRPATA